MRWWRRIKMYKNLLLVLLVLNAFLVITGASFVVRHYQGQRQAEAAYQTQIEQLRALDQLSLKLDELEKAKTWTGEQWLQLGSLKAYAEAHLPGTDLRFNEVLSHQTPELQALKQNIVAAKAQSLEALVDSGRHLGQYRTEIIVIAILSLLLGFVLPSILFYLLKRQSLKLHSHLENQVVSTLKMWRDQSEKHKGNTQFALFWLDVGVLTLAQVTKEIDHPAAVYIHQLAQMLARELQRPSENDIVRPE